MRCASNAHIPIADATDGECRLTDGVVAMTNLQAQIDGLQGQRHAGRRPAVREQAELIELVALRGQVLGRIDDYEWCSDEAEQLTREAPADSAAFIARARVRARFHRFADALADLERAQRLGADCAALDSERAGIFQATGRYEAALTIYREAMQRHADFNSLAALATLRAERGEIATAEPLFDASRSCYRGVSPIPLAMLDFQRGHMWLAHGDLQRALKWFECAVHRLPAYAPAQGHLAEVEAALGECEAAIARLLPLTTSSDDPDYAASLARVLSGIGRPEEARSWRARAAARYQELVMNHCQAFADHAAAFLLDSGEDPHRALSLARKNLEVRRTVRAVDLCERATRACREVGLAG